MSRNQKKTLGRGLSSILGEGSYGAVYDPSLVEQVPETYDDIQSQQQDAANKQLYIQNELAIDRIVPNPDQPRVHFAQDELEELAASITRDGLLQPVVVRPFGDVFQIIAGERRYQASKKAGLKSIPVRVLDIQDDKIIELAMIENIQRSNLNPLEEAYGYKQLMDQQGLTQAQVAEVMSKGRSTIANALRLLDLPESAQQLLFDGSITAGHARAILSIESQIGQEKLTDILREKKLSVREAESLARMINGKEQARELVQKTSYDFKPYKKTVSSLAKQLDTKVRLKSSGGKHRIEIDFKNEEELERIMTLLDRTLEK